MSENSMDNASLGRMLILAGASLDEALADLLKVEIRRLKQAIKDDTLFEEAKVTLNLLRSINMAIMLTDEKIKTGLDLCKGIDQNK
jgi:hypothetical protein